MKVEKKNGKVVNGREKRKDGNERKENVEILKECRVVKKREKE